jgi:hypothetical protein
LPIRCGSCPSPHTVVGTLGFYPRRVSSWVWHRGGIRRKENPIVFNVGLFRPNRHRQPDIRHHVRQGNERRERNERYVDEKRVRLRRPLEIAFCRLHGQAVKRQKPGLVLRAAALLLSLAAVCVGEVELRDCCLFDKTFKKRVKRGRGEGKTILIEAFEGVVPRGGGGKGEGNTRGGSKQKKERRRKKLTCRGPRRPETQEEKEEEERRHAEEFGRQSGQTSWLVVGMIRGRLSGSCVFVHSSSGDSVSERARPSLKYICWLG